MLCVQGGDRGPAALHPEPGCSPHHSSCGSHFRGHRRGPPPCSNWATPNYYCDNKRQSTVSELCCFTIIILFCYMCKLSHLLFALALMGLLTFICFSCVWLFHFSFSFNFIAFIRVRFQKLFHGGYSGHRGNFQGLLL